MFVWSVVIALLAVLGAALYVPLVESSLLDVIAFTTRAPAVRKLKSCALELSSTLINMFASPFRNFVVHIVLGRVMQYVDPVCVQPFAVPRLMGSVSSSRLLWSQSSLLPLVSLSVYSST